MDEDVLYRTLSREKKISIDEAKDMVKRVFSRNSAAATQWLSALSSMENKEPAEAKQVSFDDSESKVQSAPIENSEVESGTTAPGYRNISDEVLYATLAKNRGVSVSVAREMVEHAFRNNSTLANTWLTTISQKRDLVEADSVGKVEIHDKEDAQQNLVNYWHLTDEEVISLNNLEQDLTHNFFLHTPGGFSMVLGGLLMKRYITSLRSKTTNRKIVTMNLLDAWLADPGAHICGDVSDVTADLWDQQLEFIAHHFKGKVSSCKDYRTCNYHATGLLFDHLTVKGNLENLLLTCEYSGVIFAHGIYPFSPVLYDEYEDGWHETSDHTLMNISDGKVMVYHKTAAGFAIDPLAPIYDYDEIMDFLHVCHLQREHKYVMIPADLWVNAQIYELTRAPWGTPPTVPSYSKVLASKTSTFGLSYVTFPDYRTDKMGGMFVDSRLISKVQSEVFQLKDLRGTLLFVEIFGLVRDYFTRTVADNMMSVQIQPTLRLDEIQAISWALYFQRTCDKMKALEFNPKVISTTILEAASDLLVATKRAITEKFQRFYESLINKIVARRKFPEFVTDLTTISWPARARELIIKKTRSNRLHTDDGEWFYGDASDKGLAENLFDEEIDVWDIATSGLNETLTEPLFLVEKEEDHNSIVTFSEDAFDVEQGEILSESRNRIEDSENSPVGVFKNNDETKNLILSDQSGRLWSSFSLDSFESPTRQEDRETIVLFDLDGQPDPEAPKTPPDPGIQVDDNHPCSGCRPDDGDGEGD